MNRLCYTARIHLDQYLDMYTYSGGGISWASRRQNNGTVNAVDVEYTAIECGSREACWLRRVMASISRPLTKLVPVKIESQVAYRNVINDEGHTSLKYVEMQMHASRDRHNIGTISIETTDTKSQFADLFTKTLDGSKL